MVAPIVLHVVRHGEVFNPTKILYGRLPHFGLSETGLGQASATGRFLADRPIASYYVSPMQRAVETATIIANARHRSFHLVTDERLNEINTPHQGRPLADLELEGFALFTGNQPPYETIADVQARLFDFVATMRHQHPHQEVVAVTHGDNVVTLFLHAVGDANTDMGRGRLPSLGLPESYPATASILTLTYHTTNPHERPTWTYTRPY